MRRIISILLVISVALSLVTTTAAADETEQNLLINGDFESASFTEIGDWTFKTYNTWYSGGTIETDGSNKYASVTGTGIGQNVAVTAGTPYRLTARVKSTGTAKLCIQNGEASYPGALPDATLASKDVSNTDWQTVTVDYDGSVSTSHLFVYLWSDSGVTTCIDDVSLTEYEIPNGIVNPKFEDGTEGWTLTNTENMTVKDGVLTAEGTDYEAKISQIVTGLDDGVYNLSANVTGSDITGEYYIYAKTDGHTIARTAIPQISETTRILVPSVLVENGTCEIGVYAKGSATITIDNFTLTPSESTRVQFLKGGEISKLTYVEDMGGKFYRADGTEGDALQIMAENGFNLARIRLLDDPGKGHGEPDYYLPEYYMTETDCLDLARRAKDKGMQILFSFAYSDYWVDGEKQYIPHKWSEEIAAQNLSGEAMYQYLENKTYEYTKDIMQKLIEQGTCPEYVSIGNEIQVGIYFGNQKLKDSSFINALYNNADMLARFLNAGARAVRETSPETKIILHSDNGGKLSKRPTFKSLLGKTDYDVIGVSYYPFYNADVSIDTVVSEFNSLISTYNKDVIIMETGYNWNEFKKGGEWDGQLKNSGYYQDIYGETQEGQRAFLTELYAKLKQVSGGWCIGDCYWDPVMIHDDAYKIGWAIRESDDYTDQNVVPNSTIFDFDGKAVEGQKAMKYNTNSEDKLLITGKVANRGKRVTETRLSFMVDGKTYNTSTDNFGEYILAVPYPQGETVTVALKGGSESDVVPEIVPTDSFILTNMDFSSYDGTAADLITDASIDENGKISYAVDYIKPTDNSALYVALYKDGQLVACRSGREGTIIVTDSGSYTLKAFVWDGMESEFMDSVQSLIYTK